MSDWQRNVSRSDKVRRIALVRALQLGDLLVAVPAFSALRAHFPEAEITLIGLPWAASFVQRFHHLIDRFVEFPGYPGIDEVPYDEERTNRFLAEQQAYGYDLALQMHGSGRTSNPFVIDLGARICIGAYEREKPQGLTLGCLYRSDQHEIQRNLDVVQLAGCEEMDTHLEFPLFEEDHAEATSLLRAMPCADRPWIALHPGSRSPARRWPPEYFAAVVDHLSRDYGAQIVITGAQAEADTVQRVLDQVHVPVLNLVGKTSLGGLAALISKMDLFISNDTGPAHIAYAVDCPSITIFGPVEHTRWEPLDQTLHPIVRHPVACSPCGYWTCPIDHRCLRWLEPERVLDVVQRLLPREAQHTSIEKQKWSPVTMPRTDDVRVVDLHEQKEQV